MKVYICTDHHTRQNGMSVVVAKNEQGARGLLISALDKYNLMSDCFTLQELDLTLEEAQVFEPADYELHNCCQRGEMK